MGILQKKCRTTAKKALAYRGKTDQNTDIAFLALRLGVFLYLPNFVASLPALWYFKSRDLSASRNDI